MLPTIADLHRELISGKTTSIQLTEAALERINTPNGEGHLVFTDTWPEQAKAAARASDILYAAGTPRSPLEGIPISIKDLFDVAGTTTRAGSVVLKDAPAASKNAAIVQRLLDAGAVIVGRTNMTEFAFSGLGLNPHYGTPSSPWDRATGRIPGGSSSGAGVAVADQMSVASIGTDTGGSVRIPSAFCGLTGFKPTSSRISNQGAFPLAFSLDSIGPLGASVTCCAILDAVLADLPYTAPLAPAVEKLRFAVPSSIVLDGADEHVRATFEKALETLIKNGVQVDEISVPEFEQLADINRKGGLNCAEAYAVHRNLLAEKFNTYDPRVASRIMRGKDIDAADYIEIQQARKEWIVAVEKRLQPYDALLLPTVPIVAPPIKELMESDEAYFNANGLILRNPSLINFLNGCALSIPCHLQGDAPVGLMVAGLAGWDQKILNIGLALEALLVKS